MKEEYCDKHTEHCVILARIDENVKFVKSKLDDSWTNLKWFIAIIPGVVALFWKF